MNTDIKLQQCTIPFKDYLLKDLAQPEFAKNYLEAALQDFDKDGNIEILLLSLKGIAEAQGGIEELVTWTNLSPQTLTDLLIVRFRINWALPNSLNAYDRHSDWHKLEVYAYKDVHLFMGFTIIPSPHRNWIKCWAFSPR